MFARHSLYHNKSNHNECEKSYDKLMSGAPMIASVCPDISTFGSRISKSLKEQLSAKIVCANVVATEGMSDTKYKPILDSYKKLGVNFGDHRNLPVDCVKELMCYLVCNLLNPAMFSELSRRNKCLTSPMRGV